MNTLTTSKIRRRRGRAALVVVAAAAALLSACATETPGTPGPTDVDAVARQAAGNWLVSRFDANTALIPSAFVPGTPDAMGSAYAATSLRLAGTGAGTAQAAVSALSTMVDTAVKDTGGNDLPGNLARLILAARSVGSDPRAFGGVDLVARLEATIQATGPDQGRFGVQDATYDGAFRQGLALAALSVVTPTPASIDGTLSTINSKPAVAWLRSQQCSDGSWMPYRRNLSTPCAFDPITFSGPDTNGTAMAQLGLHAVGSWAPLNPLGWLAQVRVADGGWGYDGSSSASDPNSTALVVSATRSLGLQPDANALSVLRGFQLGASAPAADQGAFYYPYGAPVPNLMATNDAIMGLSPQVWPASLVP